MGTLSDLPDPLAWL
jgi:hypothetical protein